MTSRNPIKRRRSSITTPITKHSRNSLYGTLARSSPSTSVRSLGFPQIQLSIQVNTNQLSIRGSSADIFAKDNYPAPMSRAVFNGPPVSVPVAENDMDIQDREESDSLDEVIMAIDLRDKETVGCCYYVAREEKLYLMEDVKYGGIEVIGACKNIFSKLRQLLLIDRPMLL